MLFKAEWHFSQIDTRINIPKREKKYVRVKEIESKSDRKKESKVYKLIVY